MNYQVKESYFSVKAKAKKKTQLFRSTLLNEDPDIPTETFNA